MNKQKQLIQIAKRQLNMDDAVYRENLKAWTGCDSTIQMNKKQLDKVVRGMEKLGFKKQKPKRKHIDQNPRLKKLGQVWTAMHKQSLIENGSYIALEKWCVAQSKSLNNDSAIDRLEWMLPIAPELIERLKRFHLRLMKQALIVKSTTALHYIKHIDQSRLDDCEQIFLVQVKITATKMQLERYRNLAKYPQTLQAFEDCCEFIRKYGQTVDGNGEVQCKS